MKNLYPLLSGLLLVVLSFHLSAQQDAQYTQFMYNRLGYNPAFAGSVETATFRGIARQQWLGLDNAPSSQIITGNIPLTATGIGIGGRLSRVTIGLEEQYTIEGSYAYRFALGRGHRLGIGLAASARYFNVDYASATPIQSGGIDSAIPGATESKVLPNFGAGIYLDGPGYYLGVSLPRLLENDIDLGSEVTIISREARHYYFMGGLRFPVAQTIDLEPQVLCKVVGNAPFDADFNVTAHFGSSLFSGLSYRLGGDGGGESASILAGFNLNEHLTLGLTYDMGLSELNDAQSGSVEAMVTYRFGGTSTGVPTTPRDPRETEDPR